MSKFFQDSPARRDLYIKFNTNTSFPLKFCPTRWTENKDVASRALLTRSSVQSVIKHFLGLTQSARPKNNKSYDTLVQYQNDAFMLVKFNVFKELAARLNIFLKVFQTDSPMVTFMSDVLEATLRSIMKRFVLKAELEKSDTPYKLIKLNLQSCAQIMRKTINFTGK